MKKVSVIGHFAVGHICLNGQTIKTKIVTDALKDSVGADEIEMIDTYGGKKTLLKSPFLAWKALRKSKNVIIFPAQNGVRVFGRLLPMFRRFFKNRKLHYVVIGGWLSDLLKKEKGLAKALKKFDGIYVETGTMKKALENMGFANIFVMPNCKDLTVLKPEELVYFEKEPYKLCTFSRVSKEKGIETAVKAVQFANDKLQKTVFTLDIYGQVDSNQTEWFEALKNEFPIGIQYKGAVAYKESVATLKRYDALLFPTFYEGEGFAGTLLDAFSAGVPVVASNWKYNAEIVTEGENGFLFSLEEENALAEKLLYIRDNSEVILNMKSKCLESAEQYLPAEVIKILTNQLDR